MNTPPKCEKCEQIAAARIKDALELLDAKERIAVLETKVQYNDKRMEALRSDDTYQGHTAEEWYHAMRGVQAKLQSLLESLIDLHDQHV